MVSALAQVIGSTENNPLHQFNQNPLTSSHYNATQQDQSQSAPQHQAPSRPPLLSQQTYPNLFHYSQALPGGDSEVNYAIPPGFYGGDQRFLSRTLSTTSSSSSSSSSNPQQQQQQDDLIRFSMQLGGTSSSSAPRNLDFSHHPR
ncbi:hypothetical protein Patl1_01324 [Pistacia atlantica]|uniref:Uncharacterized protein n=1 Tax=Pistacia atlantica TaxID=434234 RepID=A0ACC1C664_9ROSI|nr:hypothetical protein Patl1_01324 [Pistacia atlantica]